MPEYIEREAVLERLKQECSPVVFAYLAYLVNAIPAADVRPVVKGFNKLKDYPSLFECSACGWECGDTMPGDTQTYNFCPNCGVAMEES